jgi:hypothetical protein
VVRNFVLLVANCTKVEDVLTASGEIMLAYKKLVKHKRKPRRETAAFSKNTERRVYEYGDGAYKTQSYLSGEFRTYNKKGRQIKNR